MARIAAVGWLIIFFMVGMMNARPTDGLATLAILTAFGLIVWLVVEFGAWLYRAWAVRTHAVRKPAELIRWVDKQPQTVIPKPQPRPVPVAVDLIERLCRETGWLLAEKEGDLYRVRPGDHRPRQYINIRHSTGTNVIFQTWFPVRFPLDKEQPGLFARVLLRNFSLKWSLWATSIEESCEAVLSLSARVPAEGLDARLFDSICSEMVAEVRDFHLELHNKFKYGATAQPAEAAEVLPPENVAPVKQSLTNGAVRYQLPGRTKENHHVR